MTVVKDLTKTPKGKGGSGQKIGEKKLKNNNHFSKKKKGMG